MTSTSPNLDAAAAVYDSAAAAAREILQHGADALTTEAIEALVAASPIRVNEMLINAGHALGDACEDAMEDIVERLVRLAPPEHVGPGALWSGIGYFLALRDLAVEDYDGEIPADAMTGALAAFAESIAQDREVVLAEVENGVRRDDLTVVVPAD